ncbi:hypothetical protein CFSAN002367_23966 [Clostridium botulinum CFSAN002367]|nr:hypothetical protein CFSAN002369_28516 [Clostridium botulinum CFSAN002369]EPS47419.1 hypothetical protein CFSAN002367_23966 [Clostridium botulinum CFSAN002367]EPS52483.1 hypothetical protein CFSAN002368_08115 [Clostridium botulinum A1 str. CFSAN002368]
MADFKREEIEKLKEELKSKGYKLTPQRRAIIDMIKNMRVAI